MTSLNTGPPLTPPPSAGLGCLQGDGHDQPRVVHRRHPDERHRVAAVAAAGRVEALRGAGLAARPGSRGLRANGAVPPSLVTVSSISRTVVAVSALTTRVRLPDASAGCTEPVRRRCVDCHQPRRDADAVVGDRREHRRHLHRVDRVALAERRRVAGRRRPLAPGAAAHPDASPGRPSPVGWPMPNFSRYGYSFGPPQPSRRRRMVPMLLDLAIVPAYVRCWVLWFSKSLNVLPARLSRLGTVIGVRGVTTPLLDEGRRGDDLAGAARLVGLGQRRGCRGRPPARRPGRLGSNVGAVAIASRSPVRGSITMTRAALRTGSAATALRASAFCATHWMSRSMVSAMSWPGTASRSAVYPAGDAPAAGASS